MCGIAGQVNFSQKKVDLSELKLMCQAIKHRGPDGQGVYVNKNVGLGNRRLAVIDLSKKGQQPIFNENKSIALVFNGEIYNYQDLRRSLIKKGHKFRSNTDTEVVVHLWEEYGVKCLKYLRGMFALAMWDDKQKVMFLARDRLGQKPLKYYLDEKRIVFASELKAILKVKGVKKEIDLQAIDHFFSLEAVPAPLTGFKGIKKLPPASYMLVKNNKVLIKKYWQLSYQPKSESSEPEFKHEVYSQVQEAVRLRLISDVEVGAFLSGGIDSSAVVALMRKLGLIKVKTYSVGFENSSLSELKYARKVAKLFQTDHREVLLKPDSFTLLSQLSKTYEEPYGDPSALPTYVVSQLASQDIKVALNGDGGDENFAGYQRYQKFGPLSLTAKLTPDWLKQVIKWGVNSPLPIKAEMKTMINDLLSQPGFGQYAAAYLSLTAPVRFKKELYRKDFFNQVKPSMSQKHLDQQKVANLSTFDNVLLADIQTYLADVLLPKVDMASMSQGLEVRSPLLDHELMQFTAKIPSNLKLKHNQTKYIFKRAMEGLLPNEIIYRKKMGFGFPLGDWLRNEWKDQVLEILLSNNARVKDYFSQEAITKMINNPLTGEHYDRRLWRVLMFEFWLKNYF